jgi:prophage regulatory protein
MTSKVVPGQLQNPKTTELIPGWVGICAEVHKSRVQLWRDIRDGRFPAPIETGANSIAWIRAEVEEWKRSRPRRTYGTAQAA